MKRIGLIVGVFGAAAACVGLACSAGGSSGSSSGSGGSHAASGSGGSSASSGGASASSGGSNGSAGSSSSSGGSSASSGGNSANSGGSNGSGGSSSGSGGSSVSSGGNNASSGGNSASSGGANGSGGATGSGGDVTSSGGSTASSGGAPGTGGTAAGSGGAGGTPSSGSGGSSSGSACPGVAITPDALGLVATGSNSLGIHGSWFEYSDCADLGGKNCSMVKTPPAASFPNTGGKLCTSGQTSMASGAWGAGIALELNDGPPQMPYDTNAHGVKGFCFQLSGPTIPSTGIRVAFPTKNNNDNAYFSAVTTAGQHTVLFTDAAQGSWVTNKSAFEPTMVMLVQLQIPSSTTAPVPWDFCIEGFTAITQ